MSSKHRQKITHHTSTDCNHKIFSCRCDGQGQTLSSICNSVLLLELRDCKKKPTHQGLCQTLQNQVGESGRGKHDSRETPVAADSSGSRSCSSTDLHWLKMWSHNMKSPAVAAAVPVPSVFFSLSLLPWGK